MLPPSWLLCAWECATSAAIVTRELVGDIGELSNRERYLDGLTSWNPEWAEDDSVELHAEECILRVETAVDAALLACSRCVADRNELRFDPLGAIEDCLKSLHELVQRTIRELASRPRTSSWNVSAYFRAHAALKSAIDEIEEDQLLRTYILDRSRDQLRRRSRTSDPTSEAAAAAESECSHDPPTTTKPRWNADLGELKFGNSTTRVRRSAKNVWKILSAFQEEGWPTRIDDPLPGGKQDTRLRETVRTLNAACSRKSLLLRFESDGSGEGICWTADSDRRN